MFKKFIMSCTRDIVIIFLGFFKVYSDIHISISPWFSGWIYQCPRCDRLRRLCVDGMVLKNHEGAQIHYCHINKRRWNLYLYTWYSLGLI